MLDPALPVPNSDTPSPEHENTIWISDCALKHGPAAHWLDSSHALEFWLWFSFPTFYCEIQICLAREWV